jgi:hypothetical protein
MLPFSITFPDGPGITILAPSLEDARRTLSILHPREAPRARIARGIERIGGTTMEDRSGIRQALARPIDPPSSDASIPIEMIGDPDSLATKFGRPRR